MELACDLSMIKSEDLLRKMWQQSGDDHRRREIRSYLYKLREARLRDLYQGDIMSGNAGPGFGKDPLTPSHGDALVDQSFQSLKSKEIRDSLSPTQDMQFHSLSLKQPNTTGWDVQTSSEVSPDGRAYRSETVATTDGVEKVHGGTAEFKGRNEQRSSASHQGDDKNFVKKASESANTHLHEKVVIGDENSGRTEMKTSSTTSSSSSQVISSSSTVENDGEPRHNAPRYLTDNTSPQQGRIPREQQQQVYQQQQQQHEQNRHVSDQTTTQQHQEQFTEQYNRNRQETSTNTNVETQKLHEQSKRYVDMDKAAPEYQRHVQQLMSQAGEIISNTVEYPKPNVKMITTVKRLPDGTIVKNKRYETEEPTPTTESTRQRNTSTTNRSNTQNTQNTSQRRSQDEQHRTRSDVVDNVETARRNQETNIHSKKNVVQPYSKDHYTDEATNVATTFSSVKKSSRRFSTETTSETIEEYDDQKHQDFTTHGFPSVKPNKKTQEYPTERPHSQEPGDFTTQGFPSVKPNKLTQEYPTDRAQPSRFTDVQHTTEQSLTHAPPSVKTIKTADGDVVIVSSESTRSVKQKTNSERVIETEVVKGSDYPQPSHGYPAVKESSPTSDAPRHGTPSTPRQSHPNDDFSTHGFPSVRSPAKTSPDFSTHGFPSAREPSTKPGQLIRPHTNTDEDIVIVSSETRQSSNQRTNKERIIETEVVRDSDYPSAVTHYPEKSPHATSPRRPEEYPTHGYPSVGGSSPQREISPRRGTTPRDYPSSARPNDNYSAPRSPTKAPTDYSTHGFPSARDAKTSPTKPTARQSSPTRKPMAPTTKQSTTTETTKRLLLKEKEVDSAHRAFAASLRSSSPVDSTRRDSNYSDHHQRQTPRSSVSSTRTFKRDMREGSHDSAAPSERSRVSTSTVTRQSPSKTAGKTVVTKQTVVKTRNVNGSNETIDLTPQRSTKSPSPGKTLTTTTTKITTTTKKSPTGTVPVPTPTSTTTTTTATTTEVPKSDNQITKPADKPFPINEPLTITKRTFTANDASFPRNEVVEEPCIKKHYYKLGPSDNAPQNSAVPATIKDASKSQALKNIPNEDSKMTSQDTDTIQKTTTESVESNKPTASEPQTKLPAANAMTQKLNENEKPVEKHAFYATAQEKHEHEKPSHSPAPSSYKDRTHPKNRSPVRDDIPAYHPINFDDFINAPISSSDTEPNDRHHLQAKPQIKSPNASYPKEPKEVERRTVVRETPRDKFEEPYPERDTSSDVNDSDIELDKYDQLPLKSEPRKHDKYPRGPSVDKHGMLINETETISTVKSKITDDHDYPRDGKPSVKKSAPRKPTHAEDMRVEEMFRSTLQAKQRKDVNKEFITIEGGGSYPEDDEAPDGSFISKDEPLAPKEPTYKKKGVDQRETFEERCRNILGMEDNGDTQGTYKIQPNSEVGPHDKPKQTQKPNKKPNDVPSTTFEVTIEDCDDDEPLYISSVKESLRTKTKASESKPRKSAPTDVSDNQAFEPKGSPTMHRRPLSPTKEIPARESPAVHRRPLSPTKDTPTMQIKQSSPTRDSPTAHRRTSSPTKEIPASENLTMHRRPLSPTKDTPTMQIKQLSPTRDSPTAHRRTSSPTREIPTSESPTMNRRPLIQTKESPTVRRRTSSPTKESPTVNRRPSPAKETPTMHVRQTSPSKESPTMHRRPLSPTKPLDRSIVNKETTIVIETRKSKSPEPKFIKKQPDLSSANVTETEESEVDTEQERFLSEKVISCNKDRSVQEFVKTSTLDTKQTKPKTQRPTESAVMPRNIAPIKTPLKKHPAPTTSPTRKTTKPGPTKYVDNTKLESVEKRTSLKTTSNISALRQSNEKEIVMQNGKVSKPDTKESTPRILRKDSDISRKSIELRSEPKHPRKPSAKSPEPTIKSRLRSSPRKQSPKPDDFDVDSSPETSPTRKTERRRSSNISVHTEIIIDHNGPATVHVNDVPFKRQPQSPKKPSTRGYTDDTLPEKYNRRLPVTERKESAPVQRVTRRDDDVKMSRSTSENVIKVTGKPTKKPDVAALTPHYATKQDRRPNKCLTTKTINLTTKEKTINSEDMENVIIDIQHAKSSREPSPDKIVPTPVPLDFDTGKPRYPDVVQEPEDVPRRKTVVNNIPIFEEESNSYVGCHITEVNFEKTNKATDYTDHNEEILANPIVEAPKSLDYPSMDKPDDECLLSVHEKVSKFTHTAEQIKKPKSSSPFNRDIEKIPQVSENDECLLSVDQKVEKFLKTAESITKHPITPSRELDRPNFDDIDEELRQDDCILSVSQKVNKFKDTAEKLAPTAPQRSPQLVAKIERNISRQSEPENFDSISDDEPLIPFSKNHTVEIELKRQNDILSRPSVWEKNERHVIESEKVVEQDKHRRTTSDGKKPTRKQSPEGPYERVTEPMRPEPRKVAESPVQRKPSGSTPKKNVTEKSERFDTTSRSHIEHKSPIYTKPDNEKPVDGPKVYKDMPAERTSTKTNKQQSSIVSTRSRFETPKDDYKSPKRVPASDFEPTEKPRTKQTPLQKPLYERKPSKEPEQPLGTETEDTEYQSTDNETETTVLTRKQSSKTSEHLGSDVMWVSESGKPLKPKNVSHSPTITPNQRTKHVVTKITERTVRPKSPQKQPHNESVEPILEKHQPAKSSPSPSLPGRPKVVTDTVAARRNIFEKGLPQKPTQPTSPVQSSRRPTYMDHTKSSLEHTRRDSLEINKSNYSRKSSIEEDVHSESRPNTAVKFDVPHRTRMETSISEDINIEEIFELEVLEQLLETITSYELRRRIRAQIRLVKKNLLNKQQTETSTTFSKTFKSSTYASNVHHEETDTFSDDSHAKKPISRRPHSPTRPSKVHHHEEPVNTAGPRHAKKPQDRSLSPDTKTVSSNVKEVRQVSGTHKQYIKKEQVDSATELLRSPQPVRKFSSPDGRNKPQPREQSHSPDHRSSSKPYGSSRSPARSPEGRMPCKPCDCSHSPTRTSPLRETEYVTVSETRYTEKPRDRSHSPDAKTISSSMKEVRRVSGTHTETSKQYSKVEEEDFSKHVEHSPRSQRREPAPKHNGRPTPHERNYSPEYKEKAVPKPSERRHSPNTKPVPRDHSSSPELKTKSVTNFSDRSKHQESLSKTAVRTSYSPESKTSKPRPSEKSPIWADRKNVLKNQSTTVRKTPTASQTTRTSSSSMRTVKSSSSQRQHQSTSEEDSIISSYGIGPTDENGLPLFGIRALKKKRQPSQPCETTEEVTGYVIEENYYADDKTAPTVKRKEYIYSTNADELEDIKRSVESRKSSKNDGVVREFQKVDKKFLHKEPKPIMPDTDEFGAPTMKYVRRGSVKEMSEKFIRKESSQSITEKTSGYPKAGLILRTNSRNLGTTDGADGSEPTSGNYSTTTTTTTKTNVHHEPEEDVEGEDDETVQHSSYMISGDESECESVKLRSKHSTTSTSTRSFLNSTGESKLVTGIDDVLERMRNADSVVEAGDTEQDQEARALLNKFLGASVIMRGVETVLPTTKQTKTTTSYENRAGDNLKKQEVKTTRVTKTIKSGSSSSPVIRTTCDIEEIWDEEILKQLLEQATTYEERRKIRARLRELMAEREEKKSLSAGEQAAPEEDESSVSEYEEITEEVTDYSDAETEVVQKAETTEAQKLTQSQADIAKANTIDKSVQDLKQSSSTKSTESTEEVDAPTKKAASDKETESAPKAVIASTAEKETPASDQSDGTTVVAESSEQAGGESLMPLLQDLLHKNMPQAKTAKTAKTANQNSNSPGSNNNPNSSSKNKTIVTRNSAANCSSQSSLTVNNNTNTNISTHPNKSTPNRREAQAQSVVTNANGTGTKDDTMKSSVGSTNATQVDRLSVPHKEDSGTESGEDLRLLAAGLRDQLDMQTDTSLIEEVTAALSRLESSLKEGTEISVDSSKRNALLALVARLQTGLTSPEKLAEVANAVSEMEAQDANYDETSSPEADAHRSNRQRFAKRRNRNTRHTVGVSREELADARRYMENMLMMESISSCTTPDSNTAPVTPPQLLPLEKNTSSGAIMATNPPSPLYRPNQFVPSNIKSSTECLDSGQLSAHNPDTRRSNATGRRPLSGEYSVSFDPHVKTSYASQLPKSDLPVVDKQNSHHGSPDATFKGNRFLSKKQLMKRANTIDIPKSKKYNPDFDTDSEADELRKPGFGLKRTVQVSVKQRVRQVVPPFEPKTENDHKFLAFINKQSAKPGLGWNNSKSVSNWTSKFGNLKNTFEVGAAATSTTGKPPQVPGHVPQNAAKSYWNKQVQQHPDFDVDMSQQIQKSQYEAAERQRKLERQRLEHAERERREHQRLEREQLERDRIEREYYEREMMMRQHATAQQQAAMQNVPVPKPMPVNQFIHAPQSVFRPIDNIEFPTQTIFKPIPQLPNRGSTWQPPSTLGGKAATNIHKVSSAPQFLTTKQSKNASSYITTPSPTASSPIALPWASKTTVDNSDFKHKANRFEERSQNDNRNNTYLQRHNSLRAPRTDRHEVEEHRKRPSLPNTTDPYMALHASEVPPQYYEAALNDSYDPPPPTNISFTYADYNPKANYRSYPCLPTAVDMDMPLNYARSREDSLTNPEALPLVLTSSNPSYSPQTEMPPSMSNVQPVRRFDYVNPMDSAPTSPSMLTLGQADYTDDDIDSDNMTEYRAETRVMGKPQSQTAVTIGRRTGHVSDDEVFGKNSRAARGLLHTMKNLGSSHTSQKAQRYDTKRPDAAASPKVCLSPDGRQYQAPLVEPLFPQITNFEPDRTPKYIKPNDAKSTAAGQYAQSPVYSATEPEYNNNNSSAHQQQQTRANELSYYPPAPQQKIPSLPSQKPVPYVSETQKSYVVTYPTEEPLAAHEGPYAKQHPPTSLPLQRQRQRNYSENSTTSSSMSYSMPSPNTSWTANPMHPDDASAMAAHRSNIARPEELVIKQQYQHQAQQQSALKMQPEPQAVKQPYVDLRKPDLAPKPQLPAAVVRQQQPMGQPQQYAAPLQQQLPSQQPQLPPQQPQLPPQHYQSPQQAMPQPLQQQQQQLQLHHQEQIQRQYQSSATERPKLTTRSQTISSSGHAQKQAPLSLYRQKTVDASMTSMTPTTPLQSQNRVLSQQSLVTRQQQQFQFQQKQQITEIRRKSLGNALEVQQQKQQQQQQKSSYSETKQEIQQEYKSSAPADTPDIVKSSLPKDENAPILKKFGPPQRHHYMPNAYQSPLSNTQGRSSTVTAQTKKYASTSSSSKTIKTTQHTTLTARPAIVETPATPQPPEELIPRNIVFNNVSAFTTLSQRHVEERTTDSQARPNRLSKCDSWHQIVQLQNQNAPQRSSPKFNGSGNELRRTKSGHSLAVPKMFEAGIDKAEITEKQKTVQAYFTGKKSPEHKLAESHVTTKKSSVINRTKTSEKVSASRKSLSSMSAAGSAMAGGLTRSATMPHMANLNLLDESNVEDAFEQLMMGQQQTSTTEKTETKEQDGAVVTTTTKVTTRTVGGAAPATKPASPFAKFRQLDKQNSLQSPKSPSTPTTPGGSASPIFKFTDPALNARAATVKEQLLQWCQSKTREYENVQINNFSASWTDGLAFCALIHHFLPDAFDYSKLTPQDRRHNFELSFTVADEKAGIAPLLDVEDMVEMKRPDWKCVFVYVQSIYRRFRNCQ